MTTLYAATGAAFARIDDDDGRWRASLKLQGKGVQCLASDPLNPATVYAGTRGNGAWGSDDGGVNWRELALPQPDVFSLAVSAADGALYAGTEPSQLFVSRDGGQTWRELEALLELPSYPDWRFPPRPWTSHVRWIAPSPHDAGLLLVGIELGGLMRSLDGGESWQDHVLARKRTSTLLHGIRKYRTVPMRRLAAAPHGATMPATLGLRPTPAAIGITAGAWRSIPTTRILGSSPPHQGHAVPMMGNSPRRLPFIAGAATVPGKHLRAGCRNSRWKKCREPSPPRQDSYSLALTMAASTQVKMVVMTGMPLR